MVVMVLLLFHLNFKASSCGIDYVFLQFMEWTTALDEGDKDLGSVCVRRSTSDEENHAIEVRKN